MRKVARVVLLAVGLTLLTAGVTAFAGAPSTSFVGQTSINPTVCKELKSSLRAAIRTPEGKTRAGSVAVRQFQSFDLGNGNDCMLKSYETMPGSMTASASYVQGYWKSQELWVQSWDAGSIHVDVGMTITGSIATTSGGWGPNCYFHWNLPAIFGGAITWCGVAYNGSWYTEPGTNYYVWVWPNTWSTRTGYMRYCVEGQGVSCKPWGAMN